LRMDHIEHCIVTLLTTLTCHADITPNVWQWWEPDKNIQARPDVVHQCRNFTKIQEWAKDNRIKEPFDDNVLVPDDLVIPEF
jgi:hypothetical protein